MLLQEIKNIKATKKVLRNFGILLSVFLSVLGGISLWKGGVVYNYLFPSTIVVIIAAIVFPKILKFIYIPWMTVATVIGWVVTRVILTLMYNFVFSPVALGARMLGKDLLDEKINSDKDSYWIKRDKKTILKEDLEHQF